MGKPAKIPKDTARVLRLSGIEPKSREQVLLESSALARKALSDAEETIRTKGLNIREDRERMTTEEYKARNEYIVECYLNGFGIASICKLVAGKQQWGVISVREINRLLSEEQQKRKSMRTEDAVIERDSMRDWALERQERLIEKMVLAHNKRQQEASTKQNKWKAFEEMKSLETIHNAHQDYIENQNWNMSRSNPLLDATQKGDLFIFEKGSKMVLGADKKTFADIAMELQGAIDTNPVPDGVIEADVIDNFEDE